MIIIYIYVIKWGKLDWLWEFCVVLLNKIFYKSFMFIRLYLIVWVKLNFFRLEDEIFGLKIFGLIKIFYGFVK